jgi:trigger factor
MYSSMEKVSGNQVKLTFEVPAAKFDEAIAQAYVKVRGKVNIPGFRKGHAPKKVIENMYGESVFYDDAFEIIFPEIYQDAVKEHDLQVVDHPSIDLQEIGEGKDLKFTATVYVRPDVTLGEYKNLTVEKHEHEVTDEMVQQRIDQDIEEASRIIDVEGRPLQVGDIVNLDYAGSVDGVAFEGGTAKEQKLTIGSNQFIPGFEEQMVGMEIGAEKDLNVTFPTEYHAKELAGKDAVFHVKVNSVQTKEKPEMNDEFAKDVSEFDTLDEYKADIRAKLEDEAKKHTEIALENSLVEKAVENASCDIPNAMVESQIDYMLQEMKMRMAYQGMRFEDYLKYTNQTEEQVRAMYKDEAAKRVKMELVLEAIKKAENIVPSDEEIDKALKEQAERSGLKEEDIRKNEQQMEYIKDSAAINMVVELMKKGATVTECHCEDEVSVEDEKKD